MEDFSAYLGRVLQEAERGSGGDPLAKLVLAYAKENPPDLIIGEEDDPYLVRWWFRRTEESSIYLHLILKDDKERALHDHPWDSTSYVMAGILREHTNAGVNIFVPGDVVHRKAELAHRLEVLEGPVMTLFFASSRRREWGFWCGDEFVPWRDYVDTENTGLVGRGCGEH